MNDVSITRAPERGASLATPALGFLFSAFIALVAACVFLWGRPAWWWGVEAEAVMLPGYLLAVGWMGGMLFGAAYLLLPLLTGSPWWSGRLAWAHLALHVGGGVILAVNPAATWAAGMMFFGALLFVLNQQITANRLSRWDPANLAFNVAMYWLVVAGAMTVAPGLAASSPIGVAADATMMRALAFAALVGALALATLGVVLKWLPMFLLGRVRPAGLSWAGLLLINAGLLAWLAGESGGLVALRLPAWWALFAGFGVLALDVARLLWSGRQRWSGAEVLLAVGGLLFIGLLLAVRYPPRGGNWLAPEAASWLPAWFLLLALGPLTFSGLGLGLRILPFLVWHLRLANHRAGQPPPAVGDVTERAALWPLILAALFGWGYLAAGLWQQEKAGLTFAAVCYLLAALFLVVALFPVGRAWRSARTGSVTLPRP